MKPIPIILLFLAFCMPAAADDFLGTRPLGMGGAHRAIVTGNDSIVLNPAGMSLFRRYSFEAQYLLTPDYDGNGQEEHIFHASVIDNQLAAFATGLAYTRVQRGDNKKGNRYDMAFSLALSQNLMIGTNIKYLNFDRNFKEDATEAVTVDLGLLVRTDFGLNIGVVGYNLTNTADYLEHPISMAAAVMYSPFRTLEIAFDWFINFQRPKDLLDPVNSDKETGTNTTRPKRKMAKTSGPWALATSPSASPSTSATAAPSTKPGRIPSASASGCSCSRRISPGSVRAATGGVAAVETGFAAAVRTADRGRLGTAAVFTANRELGLAAEPIVTTNHVRGTAARPTAVGQAGRTAGLWTADPVGLATHPTGAALRLLGQATVRALAANVVDRRAGVVAAAAVLGIGEQVDTFVAAAGQPGVARQTVGTAVLVGGAFFAGRARLEVAVVAFEVANPLAAYRRGVLGRRAVLDLAIPSITVQTPIPVARFGRTSGGDCAQQQQCEQSATEQFHFSLRSCDPGSAG
jgi:hypothetical protein